MTNHAYLLAEVSNIERIFRLEDKLLMNPLDFEAVIIDETHPDKKGNRITLSMGRFVIFLYRYENGGIYTNLRHIPNPDENPRKGQKIIVICSSPNLDPIGWGHPEDYERAKEQAHRANLKRELERHDVLVRATESPYTDEEE